STKKLLTVEANLGSCSFCGAAVMAILESAEEEFEIWICMVLTKLGLPNNQRLGILRQNGNKRPSAFIDAMLAEAESREQMGSGDEWLRRHLHDIRNDLIELLSQI